QTQTMASTGVTNRPNTVAGCDPSLGGSATIDRWFNTSCFQQVPETTGTFGNTGRNTVRGPGAFNIDFSGIKNTHVGKIDTEFRVEVFNVLNHPQFANPNSTFGNAAFGTISAMLASPSCATCGTTERQVQLAFKTKF